VHPRASGALLLAVCLAASAAAHGPEPKVGREIVRLQGYRETPPPGLEIAAVTVLSILGKEHRFHLTARQTFRLAEEEAAAPGLEDRLVLQGERETLYRIAAARPDQRVTILADHRRGGRDLFVLAVDLCPPP
jgi:hypothetical protein